MRQTGRTRIAFVSSPAWRWAVMLWACGMACMIGRQARADVVAVTGRPAAVNVRITELRAGRLFYQGKDGESTSVGIEQVEYLQVGDWRLFNLAEKQQRSGDASRAIAGYERCLVDLTSPNASPDAGGANADTPVVAGATAAELLDRALLVRCRLTRAYDARSRFDRAVDPYLAVIDKMPECVETLRPTRFPAADSERLVTAAKAVDAVIARRGEDAVAEALRSWRLTWPGAASTQPASGQPTAWVQQFEQIRGWIEAGRLDETFATLKQMWEQHGDRLAPELFYWQGRAWLARAERTATTLAAGSVSATMTASAEEAMRDRRRAGLAFLRVPVHFSSHPLAAECLYRAGEICRREGLAAQAGRLWADLVARYPNASPWTDRARQSLAEITKATASSPSP